MRRGIDAIEEPRVPTHGSSDPERKILAELERLEVIEDHGFGQAALELPQGVSAQQQRMPPKSGAQARDR